MRAALSVVALAVGAGLLIVALAGRGDKASLPEVETVSVQRSLASDGVRFGDIVSGQLDVLVAREVVDPATVRLRAGFSPYELVGRPSVQRLVDGPTALVRYRFELECLTAACLPSQDGRGVVLPSATVRYEGVDGAPGSVEVAWPTVGASGWHGRTGVDPDWRTGLDQLPAFDYRVSPRTFALVLGLLAAALTIGAIVLALPSIRRMLPEPKPTVDRRSLLDRALASVRAAAGGEDAAERRRALDLLARELQVRRRASEAGDASHLAWSRAEPDGGEMEDIAERVESAGA